MPVSSPRQFRAMKAAEAGRSTLGIPASVGRHMVAATSNAKHVTRRPRRRMGLREAMAMHRPKRF